jgi:hypothetical protein
VQGVGKVADRPAAGRRKRLPGAARSFFHHLARARSSAPSMSFCKLYAHEFTHRAFFFHQGSCSCSLVLVGSGTGRLSATVAQTSIRGLATARTCVVAGLPRTQRGRRKELRPKGLSRITMTCRPVPQPRRWSSSNSSCHRHPHLATDGPDEAGEFSRDRGYDNCRLLAFSDQRAVTGA